MTFSINVYNKEKKS